MLCLYLIKNQQGAKCAPGEVLRENPSAQVGFEHITITGPKDDIEQAIHEIQLICDEQSKTGMKRLVIPKLYHTWLSGINNEVYHEIGARTSAKINIQPTQVDKDNVVISSDRKNVDLAVQEINKIYADKIKLNITKLAI